jgi:hypothetical protein
MCTAVTWSARRGVLARSAKPALVVLPYRRPASWYGQFCRVRIAALRRPKDREPEVPKALEVGVERQDPSQTKPTVEIMASEE